MQISFWSNMHGQGATSATTAAFASLIALKTAYKVLVSHNQIERSALEGYFFSNPKPDTFSFPVLSNQGIDALIRLVQNGRLSPKMIADYTYSLLKNNRLDILFGSFKKKRPEDETVYLKIIECAKNYYDFVLIDVHSGLGGATSLKILENSDIIVFCLNQNNLLLRDFRKIIDNNPSLRTKNAVYVISRYEKHSSMTVGNIARRFKLDKKAMFVIPENSAFLDALNNGRVFEYIAFAINGKDGEEKVFTDSLARLFDHVIRGCSVECPER